MERQVYICVKFQFGSGKKNQTKKALKNPAQNPRQKMRKSTFRLPVLWLINLIFCRSKAINSWKMVKLRSNKHIKSIENPSRKMSCPKLPGVQNSWNSAVRPFWMFFCHGKEQLFCPAIIIATSSPTCLVIFIVCIWRKNGEKWMVTHISHYTCGGTYVQGTSP